MAACLLILEFVSFELSYDRFNQHAPNIYRVTNIVFRKANWFSTVLTYSAVGPAMKTDFPKVINNTGWCPWAYDPE
jgi:putative ABC transport system permease protein